MKTPLIIWISMRRSNFPPRYHIEAFSFSQGIPISGFLQLFQKRVEKDKNYKNGKLLTCSLLITAFPHTLLNILKLKGTVSRDFLL